MRFRRRFRMRHRRRRFHGGSRRRGRHSMRGGGRLLRIGYRM